MRAARSLKLVNPAGVRKIRRNMLALQQSLRSIHQSSADGVLHLSHQYWDMYEQGPKVSRLHDKAHQVGYIGRSADHGKTAVQLRGLQYHAQPRLQDRRVRIVIVRAQHSLDRPTCFGHVYRWMGGVTCMHAIACYAISSRLISLLIRSTSSVHLCICIIFQKSSLPPLYQ